MDEERLRSNARPKFIKLEQSQSVRNSAGSSSALLSKQFHQFRSFQSPSLTHRQLEELTAQRQRGNLLYQCGTSFQDQFICKNEGNFVVLICE